VAVNFEFVQINSLKKYLFIETEALEIGVGSEMPVQIQKIQHSLFRLCHLIDAFFIGNNLISPKIIRFDGPVYKISQVCVKAVRPSGRDGCGAIDTFRDELIMGEGRFQRNIGRFVNPVGNFKKNALVNVFVVKNIVFLDDFFDISLGLPFIQPASMEARFHLSDIAQREYGEVLERLSQLDVLHG